MKNPLVLRRMIAPSIEDINLFNLEMTIDKPLKAESDLDNHLDLVIDKPWGYEYRIYADNFYDIWKLVIFPGHATSMHCHPRKETVLLCLSGRGEVRFLKDTLPIAELGMVHIKKGVFHLTENVGDENLHLIEIETPRNKLDLVRASDNYGRKGTAYETKNRFVHLPEMQISDDVCGAKLRANDISGNYSFGLESGKDIIEQTKAHLLFAVSLDLNHAFKHDIHVLSGESLSDATVSSAQYYFTVADQNSIS